MERVFRCGISTDKRRILNLKFDRSDIPFIQAYATTSTASDDEWYIFYDHLLLREALEK